MEKKKKNSDLPPPPHYSFGDLVAFPFILAGRVVGGTVRLMGAALRGTWRAVVWCWTLTLAILGGTWKRIGWVFRQIERVIAGTWRWLTGQSSRPLYDDPAHEAIRRRIEAQFRRRARFITHAILFLFANVLVWIDFINKWSIPPDYYYPGYHSNADLGGHLFFTVFWGMFLLLHFVHYRMSEARDRAVEEAVQREREWQARAAERDYAERAVRLSDDGELIADEDWLAQEKEKRR
jgi:hypothetical protein